MSIVERYGWRGAPEPGTGRVVRSHGDYCHVVCDESPGGPVVARTKKSAFRGLPPPMTGDFVRMRFNPAGESTVLEVLPRFSRFERRDPTSRRKAQTLAVNFDTLFVMMGLDGNFSPPRLMRYLALAEGMGDAEAVVVLTKADVAAVDAAAMEGLPKVETLRISSVTGEGLDGVRRFVRPGRTVALVGSSGVGKSSLLNALAGETVAATQEVQEWSGKGRHTTTSRELVMLPDGSMVVDTPGVREIGAPGEIDAVLAKGVSTHRWRG